MKKLILSFSLVVTSLVAPVFAQDSRPVPMDRDKMLARIELERKMQADVPELAAAKEAMQKAATAYEEKISQDPALAVERKAMTDAKTKVNELVKGTDQEAIQAAIKMMTDSSTAFYEKAAGIPELVALQEKTVEAGHQYSVIFTDALEKKNPEMLALLRASRDRSVTRLRHGKVVRN